MALKTVYIELVTETRKLNAGLKKVDKRVGKTTQAFKKLGLAIGAAFSARAVLRGVKAMARGFSETIKSTDALIKTAKGVGFTATQYERLTFALSEVGVGAESARIALGDFQKRLARPSFQKFFREAGFKPKELLKLPAEEQLFTVMEDLAKMRDDPRLASVAGLIFEEQSGKDIRKVLIQWERFVQARKDYDRIVKRGLTERDIDTVEELGSQTRMLNLRWTVLKRNFVLDVVPGLLDALERMEAAGTFDLIADEAEKFADAITEITKDVQFLTNALGNLLNLGPYKGPVEAGSLRDERIKTLADVAANPLSPIPIGKAIFGALRQGRISADAPDLLTQARAGAAGAPPSQVSKVLEIRVDARGDSVISQKNAQRIGDRVAEEVAQR